MREPVWILEADEDNRTMAAAELGMAGLGTLLFSSPAAFLSRARQNENERPQVAIIDARTAFEREREIRDAVYSRLIVLTTWPAQLGPWLRVGVSRFLLKPYRLESLVEHIDPDGCFTRGRSVTKTKVRGRRSAA